MFAIMNVPYSGMQASAIRLAVSANNVANVSTPGFNPSRINQVSLTTGGTRVVAASPSFPMADLSANQPEGTREDADFLPPSRTDLVRERTEQIIAVRAFEANARVLRVQDRMAGTIIDLTV